MASRSKQKEEARARRIAQQQADADAARRQRRLRLLGAVLIGAVAAVVIAVIISGQSNSNGLKTGSAQNKTVSDVQQLLGGIPQSGTVLGNPNAKVTLTYYGDLQCPVCADFTLKGGFPQLVANDVRSGKVKVVYRNFETATHDRATFLTQQVAALAAGKQQKFWDYTELFYRQQGQENSGYVSGAFLNGLAGQVPGLDKSTWQSARSDPSLASQVSSDVSAALRAGVSATPTLVFQGPKGSAQVPAAVPDYSQLQQTLSAVS